MEFPVTCPVCSSEINKEFSKSIVYPSVRQPHDSCDKPRVIVFCNECGAGVAIPTLSQKRQEELYAEGSYWKHTAVRDFLPRKFPGHYALASSRVGFVEPFLRGKFNRGPLSVLDIGAGYGFCAAALSEKKDISIQRYSAVEKDPVLLRWLKNTLPKFLPQATITAGDSLEKIEGEFDLIVLSHIVEHLTAPKEVLISLKKLLAPGGYLFIDIPNKDYSFKADVFPHVLFFDINSLIRFLHECHFEIARISCFGRTAHDSPLNQKNKGSLLVKSGKVFQVLRYGVPLSIEAPFFRWYFGVGQENPNGTWIRALTRIRKETKR